LGPGKYLHRLAFGRGHFTALSGDGLQWRLYFSTDGVRWIADDVRFSTSWMHAVGIGLDTFWAMGERGILLQSDPLIAAPPLIAKAPGDQTVFLGNAANLEVVAAGSCPLRYQWFKEGQVIGGATNASLAWRTVQPEDEATYFVVVSNPLGAAVTEPLSVTVQTPPVAAELSLELDPWIELRLVGKPGLTYELQSADNLRDTNAWSALIRLELPAVPFTWTDTLSPASRNRFYRAVQIP
jgi:hypothetical protein